MTSVIVGLIVRGMSDRQDEKDYGWIIGAIIAIAIILIAIWANGSDWDSKDGWHPTDATSNGCSLGGQNGC